jgi:hypothetical protein
VILGGAGFASGKAKNEIWFVEDTLKAPYWSVEKVIALPAEAEGRLFAYDTPEAACHLIADAAFRDELVLLKSNVQEHLERLIYGQDARLKCWKPDCEKLCDCRMCEESGLDHLPSEF